MDVPSCQFCLVSEMPSMSTDRNRLLCGDETTPLGRCVGAEYVLYAGEHQSAVLKLLPADSMRRQPRQGRKYNCRGKHQRSDLQVVHALGEFRRYHCETGNSGRCRRLGRYSTGNSPFPTDFTEYLFLLHCLFHGMQLPKSDVCLQPFCCWKSSLFAGQTDRYRFCICTPCTERSRGCSSAHSIASAHIC